MYADYNYENIEDTDCLPAVAEYLVQHMRGYYNITRSFYSVPKANGHVEEKTREVTVVRHHDGYPLCPRPGAETAFVLMHMRYPIPQYTGIMPPRILTRDGIFAILI